MSASGINVAIIGVGLVGSAVISQLSTLPSLHIVALQNSKRTLLSASKPITASSDWKSALSSSSTQALPLPKLVEELEAIAKSTGRHTVVVDNTSDEGVSSFYPDFLRAGLSLVTPNKKATSGALSLYRDILAATSPSPSSSASSAPPPLYYGESTVGAGLPILSTLKDLVATGDEILRVEGVLSGTLSYIFNEFSTPTGAKVKFSEVVRVAKENGYTEPHPDADLSGSDVARKLTILSRLIPSLADKLERGYLSVPTSSLTPEPLRSVQDGDEYVRRLPEFDAHFDELRSKAAERGEVLRYVGVIDAAKGEIKASLESYPNDHPFATALGGSDNIVSFTTARYPKRPLLVQGAGAGAEVTASGVVADLIRVAERRG